VFDVHAPANELVELGLVVDSGRRRNMASGRPAAVWVASTFATIALETPGNTPERGRGCGMSDAVERLLTALREHGHSARESGGGRARAGAVRAPPTMIGTLPCRSVPATTGGRW